MSRTKYPRTPHMPFSPGHSPDDRKLGSLVHFEGKEVVITLKRDGENTSLYTNGFHARSIDSRHHPSRDWVAAWHANMAHNIPAGFRICGENLWARHSLAYTDLTSYFEGFSVWDETNTALDWDATLEWFALLDIVPVPERWRGVFDLTVVHQLVDELNLDTEEGLVMRLAGRIRYEDFARSYAKWVRKNHVTTDKHWMHTTLVTNQLREGAAAFRKQEGTS
jgi:hypothetical protein